MKHVVQIGESLMTVSLTEQNRFFCTFGATHIHRRRRVIVGITSN
jgi:hypothetical protein